jgi:hypothetical protein
VSAAVQWRDEASPRSFLGVKERAREGGSQSSANCKWWLDRVLLKMIVSLFTGDLTSTFCCRTWKGIHNQDILGG